jgi:hypothetical protein
VIHNHHLRVGRVCLVAVRADGRGRYYDKRIYSRCRVYAIVCGIASTSTYPCLPVSNFPGRIKSRLRRDDTCGRTWRGGSPHRASQHILEDFVRSALRRMSSILHRRPRVGCKPEMAAQARHLAIEKMAACASGPLTAARSGRPPSEGRVYS